MAETTRLELATSAVTGQRSNRLNYVPASGDIQFIRSGQKIYIPLTYQKKEGRASFLGRD